MMRIDKTFQATGAVLGIICLGGAALLAAAAGAAGFLLAIIGHSLTSAAENVSILRRKPSPFRERM